MEKPIIGITPEATRKPETPRTEGTIELNWNYARMVERAGGVPIIVPPQADLETIALIIDGWLIPGGADIDAKNFGEPNHPLAELQDPVRFGYESRLYGVISPDLPILGICYGCQFLNVVQGGSLIQHLPDVINTTSHSGGTLQEYQIDGDSKVGRSLNASKVIGASYHHQGVGRLGHDVKVVGKFEDGIIEAIEVLRRDWTVGLQWHPERTPHDPATVHLFETFIAKARSYRVSKKSN